MRGWLPCIAASLLLFPDARAGALNSLSSETIAYQGRIVVNGANFNGTGTFRFELVNGAGTVLYDSGSLQLPVRQGLYSVLIGDSSAGMPAISHQLFVIHRDIAMRIHFDDGVNGMQALSPDQPLSASAYAMSVAETTLAKLACQPNEVASYNGTTWECTAVGGDQLGTGTIGGTILCPVDGAQVFIPGLSIAASLTSSTTSFTLENVPAGTHTLQFSFPGYSETHQVTVTAGESTVKDIGTIIDAFPDVDGDGFGNTAGVQPAACVPPAGLVALDGDCNDDDPSMFPGGTEVCDGKDNDCNTQVDDNPTDPVTFFRDLDEDGFGDSSQPILACTAPSGFVMTNSDCNDQNPNIHPGATELCNGIDDNCDGANDNGIFGGSCNTGLPGQCADGVLVCSNGSLVCQQNNLASQEVCDGIDNDCNGVVDNGAGLCPNNQVCQGGTCSCPSGQLLCGGVCINPQTNTQHCGGCNTPCSAGQSCVSGLCQ